MNTKRRPALVISATDFNTSGSDVILAAISSNISRRSKYDVILLSTGSDFVQTGLRCSSAVRCGVVFAFSQAQIERKLGTLPERFLAEVGQVLRRILCLID
ncbi:MAG: type II toxin-antitoxin system PemK/MazF family toxin [Planctomycetota bacterium]